MKKLLVSILVFSTSAYGSDYSCQGTDRRSGKTVQLDLQDISEQRLTVVDPDGVDIRLERNMRKNESKYKFAVYLNDTFDGYGGMVKVSLPKEIGQQSFVVYYLHTLYSEIGKVGEENIRAVCH